MSDHKIDIALARGDGAGATAGSIETIRCQENRV